MRGDPLDWLLGLELLGMKFGLENMRRLTGALGHPERSFASVHVAGTNGKGSVTAMVEAALHAAGHRSARYTSPHLERLEERFVVCGGEVDTARLRAAVEEVRGAVERLQRDDPPFSPTFFECATAAAFELFRRERVEVAVLETGLGGRLDATNVVRPAVTAITTIDIDHAALLGGTLASIAAEKAGIIKPHVPAVVGWLPEEAEAVVLEAARTVSAPVIRPTPLEARLPGTRPALAGAHQLDNAAVAVAVLDALRAAGVAMPDAAIRAGVEGVRWPGRLERLRHGATEFLLDGAHNPGGARALAAYLRQTAWSDAVLVFGAMGDKDAAGMLRALAPAVGAIVCTTAPGARAEAADRLAAAARAGGARSVHEAADPASAVALARSLSSRVVVAGSIFLIGAVRGILR